MNARADVGPVTQFSQTRHQVLLASGIKRPVLKLGKRLFAGTHLSMLNPYGYGGPVWSAKTLDGLQFNIYFGEKNDGRGH